MELQRLSLKNFRAFKQAEFEFKPGMNLIVGINGVGKSSVLDAIRIMLSQILPQISQSKSKRIAFKPSDIYLGETLFEIGLAFSTSTTPITLSGKFEKRLKFESKPDNLKIFDEIKESSEQPLVVFYSPRRSLSDLKKTGNILGTDDRRVFAFHDSLEHRELRLEDFIAWFRVMQEDGREEGEKIIFDKNIDLFRTTLTTFLENCVNLRLEVEKTYGKLDRNGNPVFQNPKPTILLDKNKKTLDVRQLSDGERGLLSIVLDLTRRLSYANPELKDPLREGRAIVLIDELDLHLHPKWQRDVVQKLRSTFQCCQFIATTHSPQIIGEVPSENIIILEDGKPPQSPNQSLGMDTNWILRRLMETPERSDESQKLQNDISDLIVDKKYDDAMTLIDEYKKLYGIDEEIVRMQTRIERIRFLGK